MHRFLRLITVSLSGFLQLSAAFVSVDRRRKAEKGIGKLKGGRWQKTAAEVGTDLGL